MWCSVIYRYACYILIQKLRKNIYVWETAVHLAVAGVSLMASFCAVLFPTRCLG